MDQTPKEKGAPASHEVILELNFVPEWARGAAAKNPYTDHMPSSRREGRDRSQRGGGRSDRGQTAGSDRNRNRERDRNRGGGNRDGGNRSGDRQPRREQGGPQGQRDSRGSSEQGDRRGPRQSRDPAPPPLALDVTFLPDRGKLSAMVREIHLGARAYPLMHLASLFIQRPDFHLVKLQAKNDPKASEPLRLFQYRPTGMVCSDREKLVQYLVRRHLEEYFDVEEREGEAPAGNFVCVGRCSMSGEILGPPNHHGYQAMIQQMVATRFQHMTLDEYRKRVDIVRDPELIEEWKNQNRTRKVYRRRRAEDHVAPPPEEAPSESPAAEAEEPPVGEAPAAEPVLEATEPLAEEAPADEEAAAEEPSAPSEPEASSEPEEPAESEAPDESAPPAESELSADDERPELTLEEAQHQFREEILYDLIHETRRAILPATVARELPDESIKRMIRDEWQRESRFPLSLNLALRPALRHMRLHMFKVDRRNVFVTPVQPRPLDPGIAIDSIRDELTYLQKHPGCSRQELVDGLRPGMNPESSEIAEVVGNLRWLVDRGHVIEFYNGTLSVPTAVRSDRSRDRPRKRSRQSPKKTPPKTGNAPAS